jgi:hypothetical protein
MGFRVLFLGHREKITKKVPRCEFSLFLSQREEVGRHKERSLIFFGLVLHDHPRPVKTLQDHLIVYFRNLYYLKSVYVAHVQILPTSFLSPVLRISWYFRL